MEFESFVNGAYSLSGASKYLIGDCVLPVQFYEMKSPSETSPEKRIMLAILDLAVDDYINFGFNNTSNARRLFNDAEAWFCERDNSWIYSFENICNNLDLDPNYLREGLFNCKSRGLNRDIS